MTKMQKPQHIVVGENIATIYGFLLTDRRQLSTVIVTAGSQGFASG
ncbi:MAG TPA: hypothetical protein PLS03_18530 [Terrimicrobiaceae bacterium]|nr:hypothetical protein [Terrimicrobiaceae bacterium]